MLGKDIIRKKQDIVWRFSSESDFKGSIYILNESNGAILAK